MKISIGRTPELLSTWTGDQAKTWQSLEGSQRESDMLRVKACNKLLQELEGFDSVENVYVQCEDTYVCQTTTGATGLPWPQYIVHFKDGSKALIDIGLAWWQISIAPTRLLDLRGLIYFPLSNIEFIDPAVKGHGLKLKLEDRDPLIPKIFKALDLQLSL